jgi:hypothetical protein
LKAAGTGSRRAAILEACLIMVPVTIVAALGVIWSGRYFLDALIDWRIDLLFFVSATCIAGMVGVIAGWWLLGRYIALGPSGLVSRARWAWAGAALGALSALAGAGLALSGQGMIFTLGLPMLVPLAHLWVVRRQAIGPKGDRD